MRTNPAQASAARGQDSNTTGLPTPVNSNQILERPNSYIGYHLPRLRNSPYTVAYAIVFLTNVVGRHHLVAVVYLPLSGPDFEIRATFENPGRIEVRVSRNYRCDCPAPGFLGSLVDVTESSRFSSRSALKITSSEVPISAAMAAQSEA